MSDASTSGRQRPRDTADPGALTRRRTTILLFAFLFWGAVVVLRLAQFMVFEREVELAAMSRQAVHVGEVPSIRGRLLDRSGRPLA